MFTFNFSSSKKKKETSVSEGLKKTKLSFFSKITTAIAGKSQVDDSFLDDLEEILVSSDVGVETTLEIINRIQKRVAKEKYLGVEELKGFIREEIIEMLPNTDNIEIPSIGKIPYVIMVVGVNGVGKTTTIGKLAHFFKSNEKSVLIGAADTFRAAAVDQICIWADRVGVPIVQQGMNADPASVAFDAVESAKSKNIDIVLIDTAGRLHNKVGLMNELSKIKKSINKVLPECPQEVLLVLDGATGQNAFEQAKQFTAATDINALAITKLDGTAKGGVVIGISHELNIPVKYIGIGEKVEDFRKFNKAEFVEAIF